jgi:protoporphyrinogen oxidase
MRRGDVTHVWVLRVSHAYPVHDLGYAERLATVRSALDRYPRLRLAGRTGSFSYMNVDGIVEDCFRLASALKLRPVADVRPLGADASRWA